MEGRKYRVSVSCESEERMEVSIEGGKVRSKKPRRRIH